MKVEIGKRYVMRNGEVTGPLAPHDDSGIWLKDTEKNLTWMKVGGFWSANRNPYPQDIVAEYVEPDQSHDVQQPLRWVENCKPDKPGIWACKLDGGRAHIHAVEADEVGTFHLATRCYLGPIPEILPPVKKVMERLWVNANYENSTGVLHWQNESDGNGIPSGAGYWIRTDRTREREV